MDDKTLKAGSSEKGKALAAALSQIEKQFGKGSIMRYGDNEVEHDIQVVSTGSLGLDIALGVGGLPRGRVVEIYGPESSGKTTLTLQTIAQMQKLGGTWAPSVIVNAITEAKKHAAKQQETKQARTTSRAAVLGAAIQPRGTGGRYASGGTTEQDGYAQAWGS